MKQTGWAINIVCVLGTLLLAVSARSADEKPIFGAIDKGDVVVDKFFGMHAPVTSWSAVVQFLDKAQRRSH